MRGVAGCLHGNGNIGASSSLGTFLLVLMSVSMDFGASFDNPDFQFLPLPEEGL